ncbi:MAG TPA: amidohydrolase family protein [Caulobacteraceae bacterium]|nr:amidohydrolase family protein [Caulobacteraceae bacterium]
MARAPSTASRSPSPRGGGERVDAHQHFWRLERGDYGWLTAADHPALFRDFGPDDLAPVIGAAGIERTVLVQAAPTAEETQFLLEVAEATAFVAGVVGWVDLAAPGAPQAVSELARSPKLKGLRPMLQDLPEDAWILRPDLSPALDAIEAAGLVFDALVRPRHLSCLMRLIERRPGLKVVIDHGAKPAIAVGALHDWARAMRTIARETDAACKLSGLASEAGPDWAVDSLRPYADLLIAEFGPERLLWGSDWPVVEEAGGYGRWLAAAEALCEGLSKDERALVFGETAARVYGL